MPATYAQLRAFVAVAESRGFTAAAARLETSQPAVSAAIGALERDLGVQLLVRERGRVDVTEAGTRVLAHAREAVRQLDAIDEAARSSRGVEVGRVRVGVFPAASRALLPAVVGQFRRRFPKVVLSVLEGTGSEVRRWLDDGTVDVGFVVAEKGDGALPLVRDELALVAPAAFAPSRTPVPMRELRDVPLVLSDCSCRGMIESALARGGVEARPAVEVRELGTALALVGEGMGATLVPRLALPATLPAGARALPLAEPTRRTIGIASRPAGPAGPAAEAFVAVAREMAATREDAV